MTAAAKTTCRAARIAPAATPVERYRASERALWDRYELEPTERFIDLDAPAARLRVQEVGSGEPVVFVHGTGGPGTWPSLVAGLTGARCILLDRPGWGLSAPVDYSPRPYSRLVSDLLSGVLDALGLERAHVVGASIGNNWALPLARRHPSRVGRIVLLGGGPLLPEVVIPPFIRLLASPVGAVMVPTPHKPNDDRGADAADRPRPEPRRRRHSRRVHPMAPGAHARHRLDATRARHGARNRNPAQLPARSDARGRRTRADRATDAARVRHRRPGRSVATWRRPAGLLPRGELVLVDDAGHVPWFDDPRRVATSISRFLDRRRGEDHGGHSTSQPQ